MRFSRILNVLFLALVLAVLAGSVAPEVPAQVPQTLYDGTIRKMFDAIKSNSYDQFMAEADGKFKTFFTAQMFEGLSRQLGPKLQQGYSLTFLTTLKQQDYVVYAWKLVPVAFAKDDYIVTLFTRDGKVSGFVAR
jgi:hypothetical protein